MTTQTDQPTGGITRRQIIAGAGAAAAGAALLGTALPGHAGAAFPGALAGGVPLALDPPVAGLTYRQIDGAGLGVFGANQFRIWQDITGAQPLTAPDWLWAPLDLPVGSVVKQINAVYQGQPIANIRKVSLVDGTITEPLLQSMTASPGGAFGSSLSGLDITIEEQATYQLRFFCSAGVSVFGTSIGYLPPPSAFIPFTGANPRVFDSRSSGTKLQPGVEQLLDLTAAGAIGRAVVFNLTVDQPAATGYLSAYPGDIAWPGNSSINYSTATPSIANTTITTLSAAKTVKLRAGEAATHAIVDIIGYLL